MGKTVLVDEKALQDVQQFAREFLSLAQLDDFDFNSPAVVNDLQRFCRCILRTLKETKK